MENIKHFIVKVYDKKEAYDDVEKAIASTHLSVESAIVYAREQQSGYTGNSTIQEWQVLKFDLDNPENSKKVWAINVEGEETYY